LQSYQSKLYLTVEKEPLC